MRAGNWVQRTVEISLRVENRRRSRDTEGEGDEYRKQSNSGTGFKIRRDNSDRY